MESAHHEQRVQLLNMSFQKDALTTARKVASKTNYEHQEATGKESIYRAKDRLKKMKEIRQLIMGSEILVPKDTGTLKLLYGTKNRSRVDNDLGNTGSVRVRSGTEVASNKLINGKRIAAATLYDKENTSCLNDQSMVSITPTTSMIMRSALNYNDIKKEVKTAVKQKRANMPTKSELELCSLKAIMFSDIVNGLFTSILHKRFLRWYYKSITHEAFRLKDVKSALHNFNEIVVKILIRRFLIKMIRSH